MLADVMMRLLIVGGVIGFDIGSYSEGFVAGAFGSLS
jgi:hypothetical protein